MAKITVGTPVTAPLTPGQDDTNIWPTHLAKYGQGGIEYVTNIAARDAISAARRKEKLVIVKDADGSGLTKAFHWTGTQDDGSDGSWDEVYLPGGMVVADTNGAIDTLRHSMVFSSDFTIQEAGDQGAGVLVQLAQGAGNGGSSDGLVSAGTYGDPATFTKGNSFAFEPPLEVFADPDTDKQFRVTMEHGQFEPRHQPSYLAYLAEDEEVLGMPGDQIRRAILWFDDVVVPSDTYIQLDRTDKAFTIQEADELDPNVSGGTDYMIAFRASMKGTAPNTGFVRLYLKQEKITPDDPEGYIMDKSGNPFMVEHHYKQGDTLGVVDLMGVVNAKAMTKFKCHIETDLIYDNIYLNDRAEGGTGLLIQALTKDEKTGLGLLQFESDTNQNIRFSSHYYGIDRMSLDWVTSQNNVPVDILKANSAKTMADGIHLQNINEMKVGVVNGQFVFEDNGKDDCDFNFGKVFSAVETQMLRGKVITVTVTMTNPDTPFEVGLVKWTGAPDKYTQEITAERPNDGLVFQPNWEAVPANYFKVQEDGEEHTEHVTFTVPTDANNYAVIIYPAHVQRPLNLHLKQLKVDVKTPFTGYVLQAPENHLDDHLQLSKTYKEFHQTNWNGPTTTYVLNNNPDEGQPMPCGMAGKGSGPVVVDSTVNTIYGSKDTRGEGALKFTEAGTANIGTRMRLWNSGDQDTIVNFWWARMDEQGTFVKIPESNFVSVVPAHTTNAVYSIPDFELDVGAGERIGLKASADKDNGAYLQCTSPSTPLIDVEVGFTAIVPNVNDDPWGNVDLSQFEHVYSNELAGRLVINNADSITIPFIIDPDMYFDVKRAVKIENGVARPVKNMDYSYNYNTQELKIALGESVEEARVLIGVYL